MPVTMLLLALILIGVPIARIFHCAFRSRWWTLIAFIPLINRSPYGPLPSAAVPPLKGLREAEEIEGRLAMMHHGEWAWGEGMFFGPLFMIAGLAPIIVLILLLTARLSDRRSGSTPVRSARAILDERFAKGEIQREEYEERRQALGASRPLP